MSWNSFKTNMSKKLLDEKGIAVPKYKDVKKDTDLEAFGFPVIQKAKKGGYDGKGVQMIKTKEEAKTLSIKAESFRRAS